MTRRNDGPDDSEVPSAPGGTSSLPASTNPFRDAQIVWHMETPTASENYPLGLQVHGQVRSGERLDADAHAASIKRGGDGLAAVLEGGYLSLNTYRARRLRPVRMHVFLDRGLLEAFVSRQTCTTAAPERLRQCGGLDLFSEGGTVRRRRLDVWTMRPADAR